MSDVLSTEKKYSEAITAQAKRYHTLLLAVEHALDGYFETLDDLMVDPEALHIRRLATELGGMRTTLADLLDMAVQLKAISQSQVERLQRLHDPAKETWG